jgi:hypothetical protein
MARALSSVALLAAAAAFACQDEPSLLCDRVRLIWPAFNIDPSDDTSSAPGLQIDIALRSSLLPGSRGVLTVQAEDEDAEPVEHPEPAIADADGGLRFTDVSVPPGRVTLRLDVDNECGGAQSQRQPFVWDGLGYPTCEMAFGIEPAAVDGIEPARALRAEHDPDPDTPGVELPISIHAGRPDITVTLFALDEASGEEQVFEQEAGEDATAEFALALGEGPHALRAVCPWLPAELRPSSPTFRLLVDTQAPDCALVAPGGRVGAGDDLDPDEEGVQFEMQGRSQAADVVGQPGSFTADGVALDGSPLDEDGLSTVVGTVSLDPPGAPQEFSFGTSDPAGNRCEDTATFE